MTRRRRDSDALVLVFVPSLAALLMRAHQLKGAPLTRAEVLRIRDSANVVAVPRLAADLLDERRGYEDINPRRAWSQWQALTATQKNKKKKKANGRRGRRHRPIRTDGTRALKCLLERIE